MTAGSGLQMAFSKRPVSLMIQYCEPQLIMPQSYSFSNVCRALYQALSQAETIVRCLDRAEEVADRAETLNTSMRATVF